MSQFKVGQQVTFPKAFGVCEIICIKSNTAKLKELNTGFEYTKRLSSLVAYVQQNAYWSEQELVAPMHKHGDIVFSALSGDGNGCKMLWDDVKKQCVFPAELSELLCTTP